MRREDAMVVLEDTKKCADLMESIQNGLKKEKNVNIF